MKRIIPFLCLLALVFSLTGCKSSDYKKAEQLLASGSYEEAKNLYTALGDYQDSAAKITECDYQLAKAAFDAGSYAEAAEQFKALGSYQDSADLVNECSYRLANADFASGNYEDAIAKYEALGSYQDSAAKLSEAKDAFLVQKLPGKWKSQEIDLAPVITAQLEAQGDEDVIPYLKFKDLSIPLTMEMTEKSTFLIHFDDEDVNIVLDQLRSQLKVGLVAYADNVLETTAGQSGISADTLLQQLGAGSSEEFVDLILGELLFDAIIEDYKGLMTDVSETGTYEVKDGAVEMTEGVQTVNGEYDSDSDTLSWDVSDSAFAMFEISTLTFHRAK